jgi:indole-3-glycerol phosphate synthase
MTILDRIIEHKKSEIDSAKQQLSLVNLEKSIGENDFKHYSLYKKLEKDQGFHFICEIKKASPSKGIIQADFDPLRQARAYAQGGASAISVLTDQRFFQGKLDDLLKVKTNIALPVLRKDFIIDEYQIYQAKAYGADLILIIARILNQSDVQHFSQLARQLEMEILLEISDKSEINKIPKDYPITIGINNRDLSDFSVNIQKSLGMKKYIPPYLPVISESGIKSAADCRILKDHGFQGALIGEFLMRSDNPVEMLKELRREVNRVNQT